MLSRLVPSRLLLGETVSDLDGWWLLNMSARAPLVSLGVALLVFVVFLLVYGPLYVVSLAFTGWGVCLVLLYGVSGLGRRASSFLLFPGASESLREDVRREFTKKVIGQGVNLVAAAKSVASASNTAAFAAQGGPLSEELLGRVQGLQALLQALERLGFAAPSAGRSGDPMRVRQSTLLRALKPHLKDAALLLLHVGPRCGRVASKDAEALSWLWEGGESGSAGAAALIESSKENDAGHLAVQVARSGTRLLGVLETMKPQQKPKATFPFNVLQGIVESISPAPSTALPLSLLREEMHIRTGAEPFEVAVPQRYGVPALDAVQRRDDYLGYGRRLLFFPLRLGRALCAALATLLRLLRVPSCLWTAIVGDCRRSVVVRGAILRCADEQCAGGRRYVVFCNPNAGLYETVCSGPDGSFDWPAFYHRLGYHVVVWNYRGYGNSTGEPDPLTLGLDGAEIIKFLQQQHGAASVVVHGESIGGLVAAAVCGALSGRREKDGITKGVLSAVVLDRTLASVGAAASGLLGSWAATALAVFTGWYMDLVSPVLSAEGIHKIIAQDPNDVVIANHVGIKAGIATRLVLGEPKRYHMSPFADFFSDSMPQNMTVASKMVRGFSLPCVPGPSHYACVAPRPPQLLLLCDATGEAPPPRRPPVAPFMGGEDTVTPGHPPPPPPRLKLSEYLDGKADKEGASKARDEGSIDEEHVSAEFSKDGLKFLASLDEEMCAHFAACVRYIAIKARKEMMPALLRKAKSLRLLERLAESSHGKFDELQRGIKGMMDKHKADGTMPSDSDDDSQEEKVEEGAERLLQEDQHRSAASDDMEDIMHSDEEDPWETWNMWAFSDGRAQGGYATIWTVLARCHDGGGEVLGRAASRGFSGCRAWLCGSVAWGAPCLLKWLTMHSSPSFEALSAFFSTDSESAALQHLPNSLLYSVVECEFLMSRVLGGADVSRKVATDPAVLFVKGVLRGVSLLHQTLLSRGAAVARKVSGRGSPRGSGDEAPFESETCALLRDVMEVDGASVQPVSKADTADVLLQAVAVDIRRVKGQPAAPPKMGVLLPLTCGHNNSYSGHEQLALEQELRCAEQMHAGGAWEKC